MYAHTYIKSIMNDQINRHEVLDKYVSLLSDAIGYNFLLMDDNFSFHCEILVTNYLEREGI